MDPSMCCAGPVPPEFDDLFLSGSPSLAEWFLWVDFESRTPTMTQVSQLGQAFDQWLHLVVFYCTDGGATSKRILNRFGPAHNLPKLRKREIARLDLKASYEGGSEGKGSFYGTVCAVEADAYGDLTTILGESTAGIDSTLSVIPRSSSASLEWARAAWGYMWLALTDRERISEPSDLDGDAVLRNYVVTTMALGGVAGIIADAIHPDSRGIVILGSREILEPASSYLGEITAPDSCDAFMVRLRRGLRPRVSP